MLSATFSIFLVIILALTAANAFSPKPLSDLLTTLIKKTSTEVNFISDFLLSEQTEILKALSLNGVPTTAFEATDLRRKQKRDFLPVKCPEIIPGTSPANSSWARVSGIYVHKTPVPSHKLARTVIVWTSSTSSLRKVLDVLDESILWCPQKKDLGVFVPGTRFYFVVENEAQKETVLLGSKNVQRHPRVACMQRVRKEKWHELPQIWQPKIFLNAANLKLREDDR